MRSDDAPSRTDRLGEILLTAAFLAAGVVCAVADDRVPCPQVSSLQTALSDLQARRYHQAEQGALRIAQQPNQPNPRAWLIVAAARENTGRFHLAAAAHRQFLAYCDSGRERQYSLSRLAACGRAANPPCAAPRPSANLTDANRLLLGRVEEAFLTEYTEHFVVRARNTELPGLVARQAEHALSRILRDVLGGAEYPHRVAIYVWPDREAFLANAEDAPDFAGGRYRHAVRDGIVTRRIDLTQLTADGSFDPDMLDRVLPHEMTHMVLREYFGDAACPLFLDEGLAVIAEYTPHHRRRLLAGAALAGDKPIALSSLLARSRDTIGRADIFYAEAAAFVDFLRQRLSQPQFRLFLESVKNGCDTGDAIQRSLAMPPDDQFLSRLAEAWIDCVLTDAQYIQALEEASR